MLRTVNHLNTGRDLNYTRLLVKNYSCSWCIVRTRMSSKKRCREELMGRMVPDLMKVAHDASCTNIWRPITIAAICPHNEGLGASRS